MRNPHLTSHSIKLPSCDNHLGILSDFGSQLGCHLVVFKIGRSRDIYPHLNSRSVKYFYVAAFLEVQSDIDRHLRCRFRFQYQYINAITSPLQHCIDHLGRHIEIEKLCRKRIERVTLHAIIKLRSTITS